MNGSLRVVLRDDCTVECAPDTGRIIWSDNWAAVARERDRGTVTARFAGPECYGHTDYYVAALREAGGER